MRVNLRGVAAGSAHAASLAEGSPIKMDPSLDREEKLLRGGPKRVDCCGSLCAWNDLETFFNPSVLSVRLVPGRPIFTATKAKLFMGQDTRLS
jgi:hypothetical protein